ncbi:hypothetical protein BGX21_004975 [Mortierella sp. AD011]|nr:hypothetical protein BGX20_005146 [Mortierella sp. AD010]KAF9400120.1 hypothetical protein BGX21_004975 [Mortierella sp. AD011]
MTQAAPVTEMDENDANSGNGSNSVTVQGGIAGAILIIFGLTFCFFGYRFFHVTMYLAGFYFFANITYVIMANCGVTSPTLLLVISIVIGILGGLLLVCCSRLGVAVLGGFALYSLGLWILGWKPGGTIASSTGRGIFLGALSAVGFIIGFILERETVIIGTAIIGAYSIVAGIDFYAHTGFISEADSFINSKDSITQRVGPLSAGAYALLASFIVLAILGVVIQFKLWGRRTFRPAAASLAGNVVSTEKT